MRKLISNDKMIKGLNKKLNKQCNEFQQKTFVRFPKIPGGEFSSILHTGLLVCALPHCRKQAAEIFITVLGLDMTIFITVLRLD
jgi:hypothetical protein